LEAIELDADELDPAAGAGERQDATARAAHGDAVHGARDRLVRALGARGPRALEAAV
jgi:hypothetical protein